MIATVQENVMTSASNQPYDKGKIDFFTLRGAHHKAGNFVLC